MISYLLYVVSFPDGYPISMWLVDADVDAYDGLGDATLTLNRAKAQRFPSSLAALDYWQRQSTIRPLRADGRPNRPLTTFSVELQRVFDPLTP